ncbi:helix-turn-helix domain-containing protein [Faecalibacterium prausnitzii]|jgi:hypothetical protein|uniref:Helix-turn-helix domain-containing protein n=1 Tax=Faecalibacterium prausnitzii TaxID=853 RepID=A0A844DD14_9FIRM|nr:helix-turn-helix transcriptional regulator [Faecalibacterium prausnitzii]MSC50348.1 helix-turn-helix domain-containing protein [Faecalibacterium prausnitzii]DAS09971.1 MAG TPA: helix-turn-helix domain protein [Caudoviricetes sp.]
MIKTDLFAERLKELRKLSGDSQRKLAEKLFISQVTVSCYEQGRARPSFETLVAICKLYGTSSDYLLGLTDDDPSDEFRKNRH